MLEKYSVHANDPVPRFGRSERLAPRQARGLTPRAGVCRRRLLRLRRDLVRVVPHSLRRESAEHADTARRRDQRLPVPHGCARKVIAYRNPWPRTSRA